MHPCGRLQLLTTLQILLAVLVVADRDQLITTVLLDLPVLEFWIVLRVVSSLPVAPAIAT